MAFYVVLAKEYDGFGEPDKIVLVTSDEERAESVAKQLTDEWGDRSDICKWVYSFHVLSFEEIEVQYVNSTYDLTELDVG